MSGSRSRWRDLVVGVALSGAMVGSGCYLSHERTITPDAAADVGPSVDSRPAPPDVGPPSCEGVPVLGPTVEHAAPDDSPARFGFDVDMHEGEIVAGAPGDFAVGGRTSAPGAVYSYGSLRDEPVEVTPLTRSVDDLFGVSVILGNGKLVVGARDGAHVFGRRGSWDWETLLRTPSSHSGTRVAMAEDVLVVGFRGGAHVFTIRAGAWTLEAELTEPGTSPSDTGPTDVAVSDDGRFVTIGARHTEDFTGSAFVFDRELDWEGGELQRPSDLSPGASFGERVAFAEDLLFVSAPRQAVAGTDVGVVHVYWRPEFTWILDTQILSCNPTPGARFGSALAAWDGHLLVGARSIDAPAVTSVHRFERTRTREWEETEQLRGMMGDSALALAGEGEVAVSGAHEIGRLRIYAP